MSNLENRGSLINEELVVGHSEATQYMKYDDFKAFDAYAGTKRSIPDPKELHKFYTLAQLEIALIRAKSKQIDNRIDDLRQQAAKLQAELAVKEKA